jgi:D-alanine-D-alanine ligase
MRTKVGVFFGGRSVEHEISVISALQATAALDPARYETIPIYITKQGRWFTGSALLDTAAYRDMAALTARATEVWMKPEYGDHHLYRKGRFGTTKVVTELDVALPVLHGTNGEDGTFQGLMELVGIPYVGCNVLSSAVGMDKIAMKMMLRESGIPVIDYVWFTDRQWGGAGRDELVERVEAEIGYPVIVKPANLGSSVGISRARGREELVSAVGEAIGYSSRIIVERMIESLREINCSVCGNADDHRASVCEEPLRSGEILSYADKYMSGGGGSKGGTKAKPDSGHGVKTAAVSEGMSSTKRRIPADLPEAVSDEIRRLAAETFGVLGCEGVARVDFILDGSNGHDTVYVNEINTIPGSLSFYLWEATGLSFGKLMDLLIAQALKRERDKGHKTVSYDQNIFAFSGTGNTGAKGGTKFTGKK